MGKQFDRIGRKHAAFIASQHVFFTASAAAGGRMNVSPRGTDAFRVVDPRTVTYLDETGSGNETAAHLRLTGRLTMMFCSFAAKPMILRLYGQGRSLPKGSDAYQTMLRRVYGNQQPPGARQIVCLDVDLVQLSCGNGVPMFDFVAARPTLRQRAAAKGEAWLAVYRQQNNAFSIDGFPTGILPDSGDAPDPGAATETGGPAEAAGGANPAADALATAV
jgi:pyridoxamine 5'-phosphate oxidase-like protein